jgi:hypothetical protein
MAHFSNSTGEWKEGSSLHVGNCWVVEITRQASFRFLDFIVAGDMKSCVFGTVVGRN